MPRRDFGSMLGNIESATTVKEPAAAPEPQTAPAKPTPAPAASRPSARPSTPRKTAKTKVREAQPDTAAGGVGYENLERKDVRLHERQLDALADLTRKLNRRRAGEGHRITENTLIRLSIDLLLQRADDLEGTTEADLARSLKLS